jgi:hypothetical protein
MLHLTETVNEEGQLVFVEAAQHEDGTFSLDGAPVEAQSYREQRLNTDHIFIHEDSAYFD